MAIACETSPSSSSVVMNSADILFIVAHPDDVARSFGGTAALLAERHRLHVVCASQGERGYAWSGTGIRPPDHSLGARRAAEERAACDLLGSSLEFLGLIDGEICATREAIARCTALIARLQPAMVFTHAAVTKADHAATAMIAFQALHAAGRFWETELYRAVWGGENLDGRGGEIYVNITRVAERKRQLVRCHASQNPTAEHVERVMLRNRDLGRLAWCDLAEAFTCSLPPMARRWQRSARPLLLDLED